MPAQPLGFYLRQPVVLATGLAFFGYNYILFFFLTWFPSYLTMAQGLSIKNMSIATVHRRGIPHRQGERLNRRSPECAKELAA
jgi:hypothetical protein